MTFNPIAAKTVYECKNLISSKVPVAIDLGSQTATINTRFLEYLIKNYQISSERVLSEIFKIKERNKFSTKDYFKAIGYDDYYSIDINGAYGSLEFDLNLDIRNTYNFRNQYDLVINNGTGEHVFNQHSLYLNFHNLCKKNGLMVNIVPFIDWINHGFYNYNPIFFADLAASNNYEIIKITLANRDGAELLIPLENQKYLYEQIKPNKKISNFRTIVNLAQEKLGKNILLVVISRKISESDFTPPLQGKYLSDIEHKDFNYKDQKTGSANSLGQVADNKKRY